MLEGLKGLILTSESFCKANLDPKVRPGSKITSSGRILHDMLLRSADVFLCLNLNEKKKSQMSIILIKY